MKNTQASAMFSLLKGSMESLEKKLEKVEHHTSRDTSCFEDRIISTLLRVDISLAAISKSLQVLQTQTDLTAAKVETILNMVQNPAPPVVEMSWANHLPTEWGGWDNGDWLTSLMKTPERISSPDITCYETIVPCKRPLIDLESGSVGTMENLELESPGKRMKK